SRPHWYVAVHLRRILGLRARSAVDALLSGVPASPRALDRSGRLRRGAVEPQRLTGPHWYSSSADRRADWAGRSRARAIDPGRETDCRAPNRACRRARLPRIIRTSGDRVAGKDDRLRALCSRAW